MIDNPSIAVHALARRALSSLSVDEILLPKYVNLSTNLRGPPFRVEMAPSQLKLMYSILLAFSWRSKPPAACSRLIGRNSVWVDIFA